MKKLVVKPITSGPKFHFKAYYNIQPWNASGRLFLCMESDFQDRPPGEADEIRLGVVEAGNTEFHSLTTTSAWNFQQGCMPHWLDNGSNTETIYNDREKDKLFSVVMDINTGKKRTLPLPVQAVTSDGQFAASLNYARWGHWRPGYGYAGLKDIYGYNPQPRDDAVSIMDIETGQCRILTTFGDIAKLTSDLDGRKNAPMHLCHLMFNTDNTKLMGLARWWCPELAHNVYKPKLNIDGAVPERRHCMWVVNTDGSGLEIIVNDGLVSHTAWRDPWHIVAWANRKYDEAPAYMVFDVRDKSSQTIGEKFLHEDGHMSYHRETNLLLTDTYPDEQHLRSLKVYNIQKDRETILGRFLAPPELTGEMRCDLHPTWNRDFNAVAIDSIHENGIRQVYMVEAPEQAMADY